VPIFGAWQKQMTTAPRWRVTRIAGARATELCELEATSAEEAVKRAIREFEIAPEQQNRIAAYRVA
jgi:hypothetical protein